MPAASAGQLTSSVENHYNYFLRPQSSDINFRNILSRSSNYIFNSASVDTVAQSHALASCEQSRVLMGLRNQPECTLADDSIRFRISELNLYHV